MALSHGLQLRMVVALLVCAAVVPRLLATDVHSFAELRRIVQSMEQERFSLLDRSTGEADIYIETTKGDVELFNRAQRETEKAYQPALTQKSGVFALQSPEGYISASVSWYQKGNHRRHDLLIPEPPQNQGDGARQSLLPAREMRIVIVPEGGITYSLLGKQVSLTPPASRKANLLSQVNAFNIRDLYCYDGHTVTELFDAWATWDREPQITVEEVDNRSLIKVDMTISATARCQLWLDPASGYSLVRGCSTRTESDQTEPHEVVSYEAKFTKNPQRGVYVLSHLDYSLNQGPINESVRIDMRNVELDAEIADEVFTFDGLGVPSTTVINDRRLGKLSSYYLDARPLTGLDDTLAQILEVINTGDAKAATSNPPGTDSISTASVIAESDSTNLRHWYAWLVWGSCLALGAAYILYRHRRAASPGSSS